MNSSSNGLCSEGRRWLEAGKTLASDPNVQVRCRTCEVDHLIVTDAAWNDGVHLDRHMQCPKCGARNVLTKFSEGR